VQCVAACCSMLQCGANTLQPKNTHTCTHMHLSLTHLHTHTPTRPHTPTHTHTHTHIHTHTHTPVPIGRHWDLDTLEEANKRTRSIRFPKLHQERPSKDLSRSKVKYRQTYWSSFISLNTSVCHDSLTYSSKAALTYKRVPYISEKDTCKKQ